MLFLCLSAQAAAIDTYIEDFDGRQDDATIDEVDSWSVDQGETSSAVTQASTTYSGSGKALELTGAETAINVSRSATYGDLSPSWIEFIAKPGIGAQRRDVPTGKIAAVSFDYTGKVYAADGSSWQDTGVTFTEDEWYRVILKLDFETHEYDIYIEPVASPESEFVADKTDLNFIDSTISSLSQLGFEGVYSISRTDDSFVDDLIVHFVDRLEIITAPQTLTKEEPSNLITVQLQNANAAPQTAWRDITLELKSSSAQGEFSLDKGSWLSVSQVTIPEDAQEISFYYKDKTAGKPIISVQEYPDRGWQDALQQQKVVTELNYFRVVLSTPQVAGQGFVMEIIAEDEDGEPDQSYGGEVEITTRYISPMTGTAEISPNQASGFSQGKVELICQYPDCGAIEIMVQDTTDSAKAGISPEILFIPASFVLEAATPQVVSASFPLKVSALNAQGASCPNYQGQVGLSVEAVTPPETEGLILPASIPAEEFSYGAAEKSVSFNRWGTIKLAAHDSTYPEKTGVSEAINFIPQGLLVEAEEPSGERDFYYVGETIPISVSAIDAEQAPIANYQGAVTLTATLGLTLPEVYTFIASDAGSHSFSSSASVPGSFQVEVEDQAGVLSGTPASFEVIAATLEVVSTTAPVGTAEVVINLVDNEGNIITTENELTVTVKLSEEEEDASASSPSSQTPATFNQGRAWIVVNNTQAEIVTVSPASTLEFDIKSGTVTFGRISKSGIGALMWREIKD
ncbi:hypothetical protein ACFL2I_06795 [Candidatus Omnitrophota bacterium]